MMKKNKLMMTAAAVGSLAFAAELPIDKDHAAVTFSIPHMVVSRTKGGFTEFDGTLTVEDDKLTAVNAVIQVKSIDTKNRRRDDHLRSDDFFDVENHPTMTFESTAVHADKIVGNLTIKGVTKEVELKYTFKGPVTDPWGNVRYGFNADTTIDRTDFGLTWNQVVEAGAMLVGEKVDITVSVEVIQGE
ncbi:MAG: YceI family protein [Kiritimatiellae bacterium]|nr:YceI family protein [Kiritimatiellia bacterium]